VTLDGNRTRLKIHKSGNMLPTSGQHAELSHTHTNREREKNTHTREVIIYQTRSTARTTRTQFSDTQEKDRERMRGGG